MLNKLLIENYSKFMKKRTRYFYSPLLTLNGNGFIQLGQFEKDKDYKTKDTIIDLLKAHQIESGHIVWRTVYNGWGLPWAQVWYNNKILDEYENEINE
jgi:hypothetical protein